MIHSLRHSAVEPHVQKCRVKDRKHGKNFNPVCVLWPLTEWHRVIRWIELAPLGFVATVLNDLIILKPTSWRLDVPQTHIEVTHRALADSFAAFAFVVALAHTLLVHGFLYDFKLVFLKPVHFAAQIKHMQNIVSELVRPGLMEETMNRAECHANIPFSDIFSSN